MLRKIFKIVSKVLWVLCCGLWFALLWCVSGITLCLTIIGIPFGLQCFKAARLSFLPQGKRVMLHFKTHPVANIFWILFGGWEMALAYLAIGVANCITLIGIPRGIQCFKIMKLAIFPFGATVEADQSSGVSCLPE